MLLLFITVHISMIQDDWCHFFGTCNSNYSSPNETSELLDNQCFCSYQNSKTYASFNFVVVMVIMPIVSIFGIFSNIVNIFVYSRQSMRNSANTYLMALAASDFIVVLTGSLFWIDSGRFYVDFLKYGPYIIVVALPIGFMAQTSSIYITIAAAVDCCVAQRFSQCFPNYNTTKRAKQILLCIFCTSVLYNSINMVYNIYMYMFFMTIVPFLLLTTLTGLIVARVRYNNPSAQSPITMVMVVVILLSCNLLALSINIIETLMQPSASLLNSLVDVSNLLVILNSSINFVIYMVFSKKFFTTFCKYFCCATKLGSNRQTKRHVSLMNSELLLVNKDAETVTLLQDHDDILHWSPTCACEQLHDMTSLSSLNSEYCSCHSIAYAEGGGLYKKCLLKSSDMTSLQDMSSESDSDISMFYSCLSHISNK